MYKYQIQIPPINVAMIGGITHSCIRQLYMDSLSNPQNISKFVFRTSRPLYPINRGTQKDVQFDVYDVSHVGHMFMYTKKTTTK